MNKKNLIREIRSFDYELLFESELKELLIYMENIQFIIYSLYNIVQNIDVREQQKN